MKSFKTLSIEVTDEPPTEFRIFTAGVVDTVKGEFLFDAKASKLVLAEYAEHGIDLMIDYDHASLGAESAIDPANAGKAAGWFNIEVRGGELWAVNVRWTPPAAEALKRKEWRFMSPAFSTDKSGRVTSLLNVALTNIPATRRLDPLVAASSKGMNSLDPSLIKQALEAIEKGDAKSALDLLKSLVASAAGAAPDDDADDAGSEGDGAEGVAPPTETESVEEPKVVDASDTPPPPPAKKPAAGAADEDDEDDDAPAKKANRKVLRSALCRLTGKASFAEAVAEVEVYRESHVRLESGLTRLAAERAVLESAERRKLVVDLVRLGAEFPGTIWADPTAAKPSKIKSRWLKMPIAELRAHVSEQKTARGDKAAKNGVKPPTHGGVVELDLSDSELAICKELNCDPKEFAALKRMRGQASDNGTASEEYLLATRAREQNAYAQMSGAGKRNS